jgi:hypothetical protein
MNQPGDFVKAVSCLFMMIVLASCSLMEKRREHFDYTKQGISLEEVKRQSGRPVKESFDQNESALTYRYCDASWVEEAAFGLMTATMYNWHCNKQTSYMHLYFKDGALYRTEDGTSIYERVHRKEQSFQPKTSSNN